MYQQDILEAYIKNSELRVFSDDIKVRLSKELGEKYDRGCYQNYLANLQKDWEEINNLKIKYPGNAHPVLYIYIVPDDNYASLLKFPSYSDHGKGGGKPVKCYDLDGFNTAYGLSQNMAENAPEERNISTKENDIHELSHIVHNQFFSQNKSICEGFAETLPLYVLDYEQVFIEHQNLICQLEEKEILTMKQLLDSEKQDTFGRESFFPNHSCAFRKSYVSSYLWVRGCIELIQEKNNGTKAEATQSFLEIVRKSTCHNEWLIFDIANALEISKEELLEGTIVQQKAIASIHKTKD